MQTPGVSRIFNLRPAPRNIALLAALLVSMFVGVVVGYYASVSPASATSSINAPNLISASSNKLVSADVQGIQELRQEQRDLRKAQKSARINSSTAAEPLDAYSLQKELRQEQYDMRHTNAQSVPVQSDNVSASQQTQMEILTRKELQLEPQISANVPLAPKMGVTFQSQQELWQEHLDLLASRSQIGLPATRATSVDAGEHGAQSAYNLYWAAKQLQ